MLSMKILLKIDYMHDNEKGIEVLNKKKGGELCQKLLANGS